METLSNFGPRRQILRLSHSALILYDNNLPAVQLNHFFNQLNATNQQFCQMSEQTKTSRTHKAVRLRIPQYLIRGIHKKKTTK